MEKKVLPVPIQYWELSTGSHIAYVKISSDSAENAIPVLFLHGGPGACQVSSVEIGYEWYKKLAAQNLDIYLYDQVGSGLSGRLNDPSQYSVKRHIEDLEAIRKIIEAEKIILIGDSWGSTLASNYIATYPDHVLKVIFTSPGAMDIEPYNVKSPTPRVPPEFLSWVEKAHGHAAMKTMMKLDSLLQKDIQEAYSFAGDEVMDPLANEFLNSFVLEMATYDDKKLNDSKMKLSGMGWWVMTMTIWDATNVKPPVKDILKSADVPALILKGDQDYLPHEMADEYRVTFRNAQFISIPECGHLIWLDKPEVYGKEIEKFLDIKK